MEQRAMGFMDHFGDLEDPRSHINQRHDLHDILFLAVAAIMSGAEGWKDIKEFGDVEGKYGTGTKHSGE
jgi:hypothetical protein